MLSTKDMQSVSLCLQGENVRRTQKPTGHSTHAAVSSPHEKRKDHIRKGNKVSDTASHSEVHTVRDNTR